MRNRHLFGIVMSLVLMTAAGNQPPSQLVTNHGFAAVTDEEGKFVIGGVPAGTYPIKMWHEGVSLTRIIPSLQLYEYEAPYEITKQVVVRPGSTTDVEFDLELREEEHSHD